MRIKYTLLLFALLTLAVTASAQREAHLRFDSTALAVSVSGHTEYAMRDSVRRYLLSIQDASATWTRYGDPGWTEHRDVRPNGTFFHYWTNEDPVYEHGELIGEFWGMAIPDSVNYRAIRWFWDSAGSHDATDWYLSVLH